MADSSVSSEQVSRAEEVVQWPKAEIRALLAGDPSVDEVQLTTGVSKRMYLSSVVANWSEAVPEDEVCDQETGGRQKGLRTTLRPV